MTYRSKSDYEQHGQYGNWIKEMSATEAPSSPKSKMIATTTSTSELHTIPTAMTVSPSGERTTCALESLKKKSPSGKNDTNPFSKNCNENSSARDSESDDNLVPKSSSTKVKHRQQNQGRIKVKGRRKAERIIFTQKCLTTLMKPKCVGVQTDASMILANFPESIGDGRRLSQSCMNLSTIALTMETHQDKLPIKHCLSESQRKFLSFLLMIILIFWITSIILDVEVPAEFCRIALNYCFSFKQLIFTYEEKQQTFIERCWEFIQNIVAL